MENRRLHGCLGAVVGLALALLAAMLLGRVWNACDTGVNSAANSSFLLVLFIPGLWAVLLLGWLAAGAVLGRRPAVHALALVVVLVVVVWCALSLFWGGTTHDCPSGVPRWWPDVLPAPGF
ncbi:hypothetical protein [Streptomyces sp. NPDC127039]|uniref:hypothetical protein n=1 Tax=Streptomyces sp. NPDC127039 TaxID=3347115 RepID=UPI003659886E